MPGEYDFSSKGDYSRDISKGKIETSLWDICAIMTSTLYPIRRIGATPPVGLTWQDEKKQKKETEVQPCNEGHRTFTPWKFLCYVRKTTYVWMPLVNVHQTYLKPDVSLIKWTIATSCLSDCPCCSGVVLWLAFDEFSVCEKALNYDDTFHLQNFKVDAAVNLCCGPGPSRMDILFTELFRWHLRIFTHWEWKSATSLISCCYHPEVLRYLWS